LLRGVINPQEGQILCEPKPSGCGFSPPRNLLKELPMAASTLRKLERSGRKPRCIRSAIALSPMGRRLLAKRRAPAKAD
jgi:hypothetical protein